MNIHELMILKKLKYQPTLGIMVKNLIASFRQEDLFYVFPI